VDGGPDDLRQRRLDQSAKFIARRIRWTSHPAADVNEASDVFVAAIQGIRFAMTGIKGSVQCCGGDYPGEK